MANVYLFLNITLHWFFRKGLIILIHATSTQKKSLAVTVNYTSLLPFAPAVCLFVFLYFFFNTSTSLPLILLFSLRVRAAVTVNLSAHSPCVHTPYIPPLTSPLSLLLSLSLFPSFIYVLFSRPLRSLVSEVICSGILICFSLLVSPLPHPLYTSFLYTSPYTFLSLGKSGWSFRWKGKRKNEK